MEYKQYYTPEDLDTFLTDSSLRYATLDEEEFLGLGLNGTFKYAGYHPDKAYGVTSGVLNTDFYVRQAMKTWDVEEYKNHFGFTRKAVYGKALNRLLASARSIKTKEELKSDEYGMSCYEAAKKEAASYCFGADSWIKPMESISSAVQALPTNTSAGLSFPGKKKGEVIGQATRRAERMARDIISDPRRVDRRTVRPPCQIALRGHLSPRNKNKSRCVIIYPYEVQILEAYLFKGCYDSMKRNSPILQGKGSLHRLYCYLNADPDMKFINFDISGWDIARFVFLMRDAFSVIRSRLQLDRDQDQIFKWLVEYYISTPIALASGHRIVQVGGVPSGTYLTLIMNTVMNYIIQATALKYHKVPYHDLAVVGDDAAFKIPYFEDYPWETVYPKLRETEERFFACTISDEKSKVTDEVWDRTFIGYKFRNLRLVRPREEWFRSALYPERDVKNVAVSFSRMFSYYCIGGCNDEKYVDFFRHFCRVYQNHLRKYGRKVFQRRVFRFGSLRVFKDVLEFDESQIIHLNFDDFIAKIDWDAIPYMFSLNLKIRKDVWP